MNKKIKITLLSLMLGTSLVGIATTIVSCSASTSSNRIGIDVSPELKNNLNNSLMTYFDQFNNPEDDNRRDYFPTKKSYNEIVQNNKLPESALNVLKSDLVFKIDNKIVGWDVVVDSIDITSDVFTQQAGGDIKPMKIKIKFKSEYVVIGSSTNDFEIETGTLGKVGKISIRKVTLTNPNFYYFLQTNLNEILSGKNHENSHQEMRKIYERWINTKRFEDFPIEIRNLFLNSVRFDLEDGTTLSFINIVETIDFTSPYGNFPTGVNEKIPNIDVEFILKPDYIVSAEDAKILFIEDIDISAHTGLIDVKINRGILQKLLNDIFSTYLNFANDLEIRFSYQDVKIQYNSITDNLNTMPPAIKPDIANAIAGAIEWEGYSPIPPIDSIFKSIRFSKPAFNRVPNAPLPPITMSIELDSNSIYTNRDGSLDLPFVIEGLSTGSIEYKATYANDFQSNLNKLLNESLAGLTFEEMRNKYNSWNVYNQLPDEVQNFISSNITFSAVPGAEDAELGGKHINAFETVIARDEIVSSIGEFPSNYDGGPIPPIKITLPSNIGVFNFKNGKFLLTLDFDSGNLYPINIDLGNNDPTYITNLSEAVQNLISEELYFDNKAIYDKWNSITDFSPEVIKLIKEIPLITDANITLNWDDIVEKTEIIKPEFPTKTNSPIGDFIIRSTLRPIFQLNGGGSTFDINLDSLESRGISNIIVSRKDTGDLLDQKTLNTIFTDKINDYLVEGWDESQVDPDGTLKWQYMLERYESFKTPGAGSEYIKELLKNEIEYRYSHNNQIIPVDDLFDTITIIITTRKPADKPTQLYEPITIDLFFTNNSNYGNHWFVDNNDPYRPEGETENFESKLLLKIRTKPLNGAIPRP